LVAASNFAPYPNNRYSPPKDKSVAGGNVLISQAFDFIELFD